MMSIRFSIVMSACIGLWLVTPVTLAGPTTLPKLPVGGTQCIECYKDSDPGIYSLAGRRQTSSSQRFLL